MFSSCSGPGVPPVGLLEPSLVPGDLGSPPSLRDAITTDHFAGSTSSNSEHVSERERGWKRREKGRKNKKGRGRGRGTGRGRGRGRRRGRGRGTRMHLTLTQPVIQAATDKALPLTSPVLRSHMKHKQTALLSKRLAAGTWSVTHITFPAGSAEPLVHTSPPNSWFQYAHTIPTPLTGGRDTLPHSLQ